jgi:GNAT superfamily N-acetyltransferase
MPSLQIRHINKTDIGLLCRLWNQNIEFDPVTEGILHEKMFGDPDFEQDFTLIAESGGRVAGFMQGLVRTTAKQERVGWIKLFFTEKKFRRQGIARTLYREIESQIKSKVSRIQMLDSNPNYLTPGIDPLYTEAIAFVEREGFEKFKDTANMVADLSQNLDTSENEQDLLSQDIHIRRAKSSDRKEVAEFLQNHWAAWVEEVDLAFENTPISLHLGYDNGKLAAFSAYDINNVGCGWFGPMGTDPGFRGKGVGAILLKRCLADIKRQGQTHAVIPWVGPIPFYLHHVGARVRRIFWRYRKEV